MYSNNKILINFFIVLAVVFTTACNNNDKIEILKIDEIWTDSVPDGILREFNSTKQCLKVKNYLLIPSSVAKNKSINIKLYGCWSADAYIDHGCETFNSFNSSIGKNEISLVVKKNISSKKGCNKNTMGLDFVSFKEELNITNSFEVGDIEIVVKNPDGEELIHVITME